MPATAPEFAFPDHVPETLRWDHAMGEYARDLDDPFEAVARLHDGPEIFYARIISQATPGWVIRSDALQREALLDYEHFTSERVAAIAQMLGANWRLAPLEFNPPEHTAYRKIINPLFTPRSVTALEDSVRMACGHLIDGFERPDRCEFVEEFAVQFPTYIFLSLFGMPVDQAAQFLAWEAALLRGTTMEERVGAARGVMEYLQHFIAEQRKAPSTEIVAGILAGKLGDRPMTDDEVLGLLYTFYLGGLDTVYSTLGWIFRHLALNPDLQQTLREEPDRIPAAVDEFARAYSVVSCTRQVVKDFTFHGVEMKAGEEVLIPLFLAGRDPQAWDDPARIDLDRKSAALTFGSGPHLCPGRHLARREMRVAVTEFLARFRSIRLAEGEGNYTCHTSPVFGVDRLVLELEPA